jgi:hypothetical protein
LDVFKGRDLLEDVGLGRRIVFRWLLGDTEWGGNADEVCGSR